MPKSGTHPQYNKDVTVNCICGNSFTISTTLKGPIKVETCPACHPAYNKGLVVKQVSKGRMEKYAEKMKKIDAVKETKTAKTTKAKKVEKTEK
ncbi:50S ribosomal protein L31 [Patescibacteria group bacterium]|nr:50S ribosomal protein L31 [Patescibacteria group bacterium]